MKRTFAATVVGLSDTDTSGYAAGAHTISLAIDGAAPLGPAPRKVDLPIFTREEARELGALYRCENAVRIIVETGDATIRGEDIKSGYAIVGEVPIERTGNSKWPLPVIEQFWMTSASPDTYDTDPRGNPFGANSRERFVLRTTTGAVQLREGDRVVVLRKWASDATPPLVNGRPSCCDAGTRRIELDRGPRRWQVDEHSRIDFCPFCGARLPEVPM